MVVVGGGVVVVVVVVLGGAGVLANRESIQALVSWTVCFEELFFSFLI